MVTLSGKNNSKMLIITGSGNTVEAEPAASHTYKCLSSPVYSASVSQRHECLSLIFTPLNNLANCLNCIIHAETHRSFKWLISHSENFKFNFWIWKLYRGPDLCVLIAGYGHDPVFLTLSPGTRSQRRVRSLNSSAKKSRGR